MDPPEPGFQYAPEVSLLPFDVRLSKVASVAGVAIDDPMFEILRARRLELGDHDYSKGLKPDLTWTSTRMGIWVRAMKPVCTSTAMRARYPALPEALDPMILAAYGRHATDEDRTIVAETVAASALDSEAQYLVTCLSVLTSLEFVAR